jgi:hypothetical protein
MARLVVAGKVSGIPFNPLNRSDDDDNSDEFWFWVGTLRPENAVTAAAVAALGGPWIKSAREREVQVLERLMEGASREEVNALADKLMRRRTAEDEAQFHEQEKEEAKRDPLYEEKHIESAYMCLTEFKRQRGRLPRDRREMVEWLDMMEKQLLEKELAEEAV